MAATQPAPQEPAGEDAPSIPPAVETETVVASESDGSPPATSVVAPLPASVAGVETTSAPASPTTPSADAVGVGAGEFVPQRAGEPHVPERELPIPPQHMPGYHDASMMMHGALPMILHVLDQVFSSLAYGIDLVGVAPHAMPDGFIPIHILATVPAMAEACQVPGALMTALQQSPLVELDPTHTMARPAVRYTMQPPMRNVPMHYPMETPYGSVAPSYPRPHAVPPPPMPPMMQSVQVPGPGWHHVPMYHPHGPPPLGAPPPSHPPPPVAPYLYDEVPRMVDARRAGSARSTQSSRQSSCHSRGSSRSGSRGGYERDRRHYRGGGGGGGSYKKGRRGRSRHSSQSSAADDEEDDPLSDALTTKQWLKVIRLHKYTPVLEHLTRRDLLAMPDEELASMPITDGARRKLRIELSRWADANGLEIPFTIPPSNSTSREGSQSSTRSSSRHSSRPSSISRGERGDKRAPLRMPTDPAVQITLVQTAEKLRGLELDDHATTPPAARKSPAIELANLQAGSRLVVPKSQPILIAGGRQRGPPDVAEDPATPTARTQPVFLGNPSTEETSDKADM